MARPTKYRPEFAEQAKHLCKLGATDAELASAFGVRVSTVALWKVQHKEFSDALRVTKAAADKRVEQSLFRRAVGFECDETDIRVVGGKVVQTTVRKVYPPDTTACIFWLKNRNRKDWRDRIDAAVGGPEEGAPIPVEQSVDPRVEAIVKALLDKV
jgi:hypothetical protein